MFSLFAGWHFYFPIMDRVDRSPIQSSSDLPKIGPKRDVQSESTKHVEPVALEDQVKQQLTDEQLKIFNDGVSLGNQGSLDEHATELLSAVLDHVDKKLPVGELLDQLGSVVDKLNLKLQGKQGEEVMTEITVQDETSEDSEVSTKKQRRGATFDKSEWNQKLAGNPKTDIDTLKKLALEKNLDVETQKLLAEHSDVSVRFLLAQNPTTDSKVLQTLANDKDDIVLSAIIDRSQNDPDMQLILASNKDAGASLLAELAKGKDASVRALVAGHPNTDTKTLKTLANDKEPFVREAVALNNKTDLRTLLALAKDPAEDVRKALDKDPRVTCARNLINVGTTSDLHSKLTLLAKEMDRLDDLGLLSAEDQQMLKGLNDDPPSPEDISQLQSLLISIEDAKSCVLTDEDKERLTTLRKKGDEEGFDFGDLEAIEALSQKEDGLDIKLLDIEKEKSKLSSSNLKLLGYLELEQADKLIKKALPDVQPLKQVKMEKLKDEETMPSWLQEGIDVDMSCLTPESKKKTLLGAIESVLPDRLRLMNLHRKMLPMIEQIKKNMAKNPDISYAVLMMDKEKALEVIKAAILSRKQDLFVTGPTEGTSTTFKLTTEQRNVLLEKFKDSPKNKSLNELANIIYKDMVDSVPNQSVIDKNKFTTHVKDNGEEISIPTLKSVTINGKVYKDAKLLAAGAAGGVWMLTGPNGEKIVAKTLYGDKATLKTALDEAEAHRYAVGRKDLEHPNIGKFMGVASGDPPVLLQEFIPGKKFSDVQGSIDEDTEVSKEDKSLAKKYLMKQIVSGMTHIQENRQMMHLDLKPDNVMISGKEIQAKIVDFGIGETDITGSSTGYKGTPVYASPEMLTGKYDKTADTWCLGVMLLQCIDPKLYQDTLKDITKLEEISKFHENIWKAVETLKDKDPDGHALLQAMLNKDPEKRPKLSDVLDHKGLLLTEEQDKQARQIIKNAMEKN